LNEPNSIRIEKEAISHPLALLAASPGLYCLSSNDRDPEVFNLHVTCTRVDTFAKVGKLQTGYVHFGTSYSPRDQQVVQAYATFFPNRAFLGLYNHWKQYMVTHEGRR
jgi:hypothetical protein